MEHKYHIQIPGNVPIYRYLSHIYNIRSRGTCNAIYIILYTFDNIA